MERQQILLRTASGAEFSRTILFNSRDVLQDATMVFSGKTPWDIRRAISSEGIEDLSEIEGLKCEA